MQNENKDSDRYILKDPYKQDEIVKPPQPSKAETPGAPKKERRTIKEVLLDGGREVLAGAVILAISFVALNWSAYYEIGKNEWNNITGQNNSPLSELVEDGQSHGTETGIKIEPEHELQSTIIPDLDIDIAPTDNRLIIPSIDKNIPIVRVSSKSLIEHDWDALEDEMQEALRDGVVHYPGTSVPGQKGNTVVTGHSSYFPWDSGRFKDVFALLHSVNVDDKIVVYYNQEKYTYQVSEIKEVKPEDIDVLKQTPSERLTLITCTPVGTNLRRLIVIAEPID